MGRGGAKILEVVQNQVLIFSILARAQQKESFEFFSKNPTEIRKQSKINQSSSAKTSRWRKREHHYRTSRNPAETMGGSSSKKKASDGEAASNGRSVAPVIPPRKSIGVKPTKGFLSHFKLEAATEARWQHTRPHHGIAT